MKKKKIIVNAITGIRIVGTFLLPILYSVLSIPAFLVSIGLILTTDFIDGKLARKWEVSTLGGSYLDMSADKLFGFALLSILSFMYPVMVIPLLCEVGITTANLIKMKKGGVLKSSELGRGKTVALGFSMFTLFLTGLSPEFAHDLTNVKIDSSAFYDIFAFIGDKISFLGNFINDVLKNFGNNMDNITDLVANFVLNLPKNTVDFVTENKEVVESVAASVAITSEAFVAGDYTIKTIKTPNKETANKVKISKLLTNKKFLEDILFNEEFYKENKDKSIDYILNHEKVKKLIKSEHLDVDKS